MALRRPLSTGAAVAPAPEGTPAPGRAQRTAVHDGPLASALVAGAFGMALRLPVAGRFLRPASSLATSGLRRARATAAGLVRGEVGELVEQISRLADLVVPQVVREVIARVDVVALMAEFVDLDRIAVLLDVDPVVAGVDLDAIVARLDIDRIAAGLDLDAIIDRLDIDRAAARLDLDAVVRRVDVDAVVARVDVDAVVAGVDLDAIVARLDIDRIAAGLDLDAIIDRLDIDRAAAHLDLDAVIERLDLIGLARYIVEGMDLAQLIRSSTESISQEMVEDVRSSTADADRAVERLVDRLLMRRQGRRTALAPPPSADHDVRG